MMVKDNPSPDKKMRASIMKGRNIFNDLYTSRPASGVSRDFTEGRLAQQADANKDLSHRAGWRLPSVPTEGVFPTGSFTRKVR